MASRFQNADAPGSGAIEKAFQGYSTIKVNKPYIAMEITPPTNYFVFIETGATFGDIYTGSSEVKTPEQITLFGGTASIRPDPKYHLAGGTIPKCNT
ncbi:hypothetical protein HOY80DRAFT_1141709 [Tuber brumale]|nr:hypothetical protein HOY80DRAFT_1141709 [Tuber brumale]